MKAIGYVRLSRMEEGVNGAGLDAQREAIEAEARRRDWQLVCPHGSAPLCRRGVYEDAGFSAKDLKRPAIQVALDDLDAGRAGALIVARLDRLSRSVLDFSGIVERARHKGWAVVCLDIGVDTSTPQGELLANVLATFATFERRLIGQRTKDALAIRKAQGVRLGRPPGAPNPATARIVKERAKGKTLRAIANGLNADTPCDAHSGESSQAERAACPDCRPRVPTAQGGSQWRASSVASVLRRSDAG